MSEKTRNALGYSGILPFLFLALGFWISGFAMQSAFQKGLLIAFTSYSVVIISFVAGSLWAHRIHEDSDESQRLFFLSNLITVSAWLSLIATLFGYPLIGLVTTSSAFILLLGIEYRYVFKSNIKLWAKYFDLRRTLTLAVVSLHILVLFNLS